MFKRLILTDLKRIKTLFVPMLIASFFLAAIISGLSVLSGKLLYSKDKQEPVDIGIVMSADSSMSNMAYNMVSDMKSYSSYTNIIKYQDKASGIKAVESGELKALILVPDNVLSSIMNGENEPIEVYYNQDGTLTTYLLKDIFVSTSSMLGTSQAVIYAYQRMARSMEWPDEVYSAMLQEINELTINYVLNRTDIFAEIHADATGVYTPTEHYLASGILILLSLLGIIYISFIKNNNQAYLIKLKSHGIGGVKCSVSQMIAMTSGLYVIFILLYGILFIVSRLSDGLDISFTPWIFLYGLLLCLTVSLFTLAIGKLPVSQAAAGLLYLCILIALAYIGGLLVPQNLLPEFAGDISGYSPYHLLHKMLCRCLYG